MALKINNLRITNGKKIILNNINLQLNGNELVSLVGLNGAGKTTLIKAVVGLLKADSGEIVVDDVNVNNISSKKRAKIISYVPQTTNLSFKYNIKEFINLGNTPYSSFFGKTERLDDDILKQFDIEHLGDLFTNEISVGELKLVYLARCHKQDAKWMLLDEPTSSLDFKREHEFLKRLKKYVKEQDKSIFMSIHNPELAIKYSDRIIILDKGQVIGNYKKDEFDTSLKEAFINIYGGDIIC